MIKIKLIKLCSLFLFIIMGVILITFSISAEGGHICENKPPIIIVGNYFGCDTIETVQPPTGETGKCYWRKFLLPNPNGVSFVVSKSEDCCWSSIYWDNPVDGSGGPTKFNKTKSEKPWDFGLLWKVIGTDEDNQDCCRGPKGGPLQKYTKNKNVQLSSFEGKEIYDYHCCQMLWKDQEPEIKKTYQGLICKGKGEYVNKEICCPAEFKNRKVVEGECSLKCNGEPECVHLDECQKKGKVKATISVPTKPGERGFPMPKTTTGCKTKKCGPDSWFQSPSFNKCHCLKETTNIQAAINFYGANMVGSCRIRRVCDGGGYHAKGKAVDIACGDTTTEALLESICNSMVASGTVTNCDIHTGNNFRGGTCDAPANIKAGQGYHVHCWKC